MLKFDPKNTPTPKIHGIMLGAVAPRPIAFASTIDEKGNPNLAPFSFFNAFGSNPATLIFSPARRVRDNTTKHTIDNIRINKQVVINTVNYDMVQQMSLASTEYPKGINEFIKAGFTPVASEMIKPFRVKESPVQFECKVNDIIDLGDQGGAAHVIICEILLIHVNENILDENNHIDPHKIDLVARLGNDYYCRASGESIFIVPKPLSTLGIGIDNIPKSIRNSEILTGNDLGMLGNVESLPLKDEIEAYKNTDEIKDLLRNLNNNKQEVLLQLHQHAKKLLVQGKVAEAWKTLLTIPD